MSDPRPGARRARGCREVRHTTNSLLAGAAAGRAAMKATATLRATKRLIDRFA